MSDFKPPLIPPPGTYSLQGYVMNETSKAVNFAIHQINGVPLEPISVQWFPLSQTKSKYVAHEDGEFDNLIVTEWIMKQKDLL
jgi:hypothetical protein